MCVNTRFIALLPFNWPLSCIHKYVECNVIFTYADLCDVFVTGKLRRSDCRSV